MHAYVDVDMQVHVFMHISAYACICRFGIHIPLAGAAHLRDHTMGEGEGAGIEDIYIIYICMNIEFVLKSTLHIYEWHMCLGSYILEQEENRDIRKKARVGEQGRDEIR